MFERYTEKARRVIFFARYEASAFGSPCIETDHLLLGLLREDKALASRRMPGITPEDIRIAIEKRTLVREKISTSVDLPLSNAAKRALEYGAEEAERLSHRHIGTEHLLLGLLRERNDPAAQLLIERGLDLNQLRLALAGAAGEQLHVESSVGRLRSRDITDRLLIIHGRGHDAETIRGLVSRYREHSWHWIKRPWAPPDIVVHRTTGRISFDLDLAKDAANFEVVKGVWKRDHCAVCGWTLCNAPNNPSQNTGYINGREWLCLECYEKFFEGTDWFRSSYSDIT